MTPARLLAECARLLKCQPRVLSLARYSGTTLTARERADLRAALPAAKDAARAAAEALDQRRRAVLDADPEYQRLLRETTARKAHRDAIVRDLNRPHRLTLYRTISVGPIPLSEHIAEGATPADVLADVQRRLAPRTVPATPDGTPSGPTGDSDQE